VSTDTAEIGPIMKDVEIAATAPAPDPAYLPAYLPAIVTDKDLVNIHMKHHGFMPPRSKIHSDYEVLE
jgi:hypothetical protein